MPTIAIGQPVRNGAITGNSFGGALAIVLLAVLKRYGWEFTPEEALSLGAVLTGLCGVAASFWAAQQVRGPRTFTVHDEGDAHAALEFVTQRRQRQGRVGRSSVSVLKLEEEESHG